MKIVLFLLLAVSLISCSKGKDPVIPPQPVDTLSTGWRKVVISSAISASDIFFINNTTGFTVAGNDIFRSTDGGNTWQKVYHGNVNYFVNIGMGSASNAIFTAGQGSQQRLFFTLNGGNSFDSVVVADNNITDVFFVSSTIAYAIGQKCWKTVNGGQTWTSLFDFSSSGYRSFHFLNEQVGWWAGQGGVYKTSNAGVNWDLQPTPGFSFNQTGNIFMSDANNGYVSDNGGLGKTTNGGATWTRIKMLEGAYHDLHFLDALTGYVTDGVYIFKTIDGGTSWTKEVRLAKDAVIEHHFTDMNHGWATAGAGFILKYEK